MQRVLLGVLVLAGATACGTATRPQTDNVPRTVEADAPAASTQSVSAASPPAADRVAPPAAAPAAQQPTVTSVDYELLKTFLPELPGWTAEAVRGEAVTMPVRYSRAEGRYRKGAGLIEVEIIDTAASPLLLAPLSMFVTAGYSERYDEGFRRASRFAGQPGAEDWNARTSRGEVTAIAGNRFVVHVTGRHLPDIEPIRDVVAAVNLARLSALR